MDLIELLPAARGLLKWSQNDLANASGVGQASIARIENGSIVPQPQTLDRLRFALERAGIEFVEDGVRKPMQHFITLKGENWFLDVLGDISMSLKAGDEILLSGGREELSSDEVIEKINEIRASGIKMRSLIEEGDLYFMGKLNEYRWIPKEHYRNFVTIIYGHKVCTDFKTMGMLLMNKDWAEAEKLKFEYMWSTAIKVKGESIAKRKYK